MANDNKLTIALVVVVGLLAIVAIVISAVSLSKNMPPTITVNNPNRPSGGAPSGNQGQSGQSGQSGNQGQGGQQTIYIQAPAPSGPMANNVAQGKYRPPMGPSGRIYSVFVGHDYGSHFYFDDAGYLSGFGIGFVDLVCEAAEIDCRVVWDRWTNCWDSAAGQHAVGGQGLHGRWYDGCSSYYTTVERSHVFAFSQPYLKEPKTNFFVLPSKSFDTGKNSILNSKIVFMDGWASDEKCLARETGAVTTVPKIKYAKTTGEAIDLLTTGGFDVLFTTHATLRAELNDGKLKTVGGDYSCMLAGNAMMTRKDSDFNVVWNRGFMKVKNNGRFKKFCAQQNAEHIAQGTLECVDSF